MSDEPPDESPDEPVSVGAAATASLLDDSDGVDEAAGDAEVLDVGVAVGLAAPGRAAAEAVVPGVRLDPFDRVEPSAPVDPFVPVDADGAEVRRDGAFVVCLGVEVGAWVVVLGVGFGAAVVGSGSDPAAGWVLGAAPEPKRKPTDEPGLGS